MTRLERIENKGYEVTNFMSGNGVQASKNNGTTKITGTSITDLHKKIFGY
jgi:hypothetical protein